MGKIDTERTLKSFRSVIQANLGAKLTAITAEYSSEDIAEYGGSVTLEPILNANYFLNEAPLSLNVVTFLVIGIQNIVAVTRGSAVAKSYSIFVVIGHSGLKNNSNHNLIESKILRYTRAVQEVISDNFDKVLPGFSLTDVAELPANPSIQLETGETLRVSGLVFSANVA